MSDLQHTVSARIAAFAGHLRAVGLSAGPDNALTFTEALAELGAGDPRSIYWAGRLSFVKRVEEVDLYDQAFASFIEGGEEAPARESAESDVAQGGREASTSADAAAMTQDADDAAASVSLASSVEILKSKSFDQVSADEMTVLNRVIETIAAAPPERVTRRMRPAPTGHALDLRRMLADAMRTEGEPVTRRWQSRKTKPRRVVFLLDISGSMKAYSRTLLQFAYAFRKRHPRTEVFCFGSSLTRVTPELSSRRVDSALEAASDAIADWEGGTRISESFREFIDGWGRRGMARSAVVIICSDGLERGDPGDLKRQMSRLRCLCHTIVWMNPLKGSPNYEPLARGMNAALPFIDRFMPGHNLASLYDLAAALPTLRTRS